MSIEQISATLNETFEQLKKNYHATRIYVDNDYKLEVQIYGVDNLLSIPGKVEINPFNSEMHPFEISVKMSDVKFFALVSTTESLDLGLEV